MLIPDPILRLDRETLATRLNELALANADGLLGDDEYRILRQTMFEQMASASSTPSEATSARVADARTGERGQFRRCRPFSLSAGLV